MELNPHRRRSLIGLSAVTALVWVTASDISIALPTIGRHLGGSMDVLQWAVNGYFLAGSLIIVGGRLADLYGRRLLFAIGTLMLLAGSVVAGLAGSPAQLMGSTDPLIHQFVHALSDGPVPFHYPAPGVAEDFGGRAA